MQYIYTIYMYIIYIYKFERHLMMCCIKQKILKAHIFCKIFRFSLSLQKLRQFNKI